MFAPIVDFNESVAAGPLLKLLERGFFTCKSIGRRCPKRENSIAAFKASGTP